MKLLILFFSILNLFNITNFSFNKNNNNHYHNDNDYYYAEDNINDINNINNEILVKEEKIDETLDIEINQDDEAKIKFLNENNKIIYEYYYDKKKIYEENFASNIIDINKLNNLNKPIKLDDKSFIVFSISEESELIGKIINLSGKIINEININELINIDYKVDDYKIIVDEYLYDYIYLFINMNNDIYAYKLDYHNDKLSIDCFKKYEGEGKEEVIKIINIKTYIYLFIYKENNAGGDFGNGGKANSLKCTTLLMVNSDTLEIESVKTFESEEIIDLNIVNSIYDENIYKDSSYIYTLTSDECFIYDIHLNKILGLKFKSDCIFGICSLNDLGEFYLARFFHNGIEVINLNKASWNANFVKIDYSFDTLIDSIFYFDDHYYSIKDGLLYSVIDLYYLKDFEFDYVYENIYDKPVYHNDHIYTFKKRIGRTGFRTIGDFDTFTAGIYITFYFFGDLELKCNITVNPFINCKDGLIYPIGYKLKFNLKALLDGYEIINDYELNKEGLHHLILYNDDEIYKEIEFIVSKDMTSLDDSEKWDVNYDYYGYLNDYFYGRIKLVGLNINDEEDIEVSVNGKIINNSDFNLERREDGLILIIKYKLQNKGINTFLIDYVKKGTKDNLIDERIIINEKIKIFCMDDKPNIDINSNVNNKNISLNLEIIDNDKTIRYFYFDYYNGNNLIKREKIPFSYQNIDDLVNKDIDYDVIKVGFVYDINYKYLQEEALFTIKDRCNGIDYKIINREEDVKEIAFEINKKNLRELSVVNDVIYNSGVISNAFMLISTLSIILIGAIIIFVLLAKKKGIKLSNKKNKSIKNIR
ncbi:MAG: hypothetical protein IJS58_08565 [Bacilli bacterium]|nr:hypothetical protein [Bacilli bacterium]